MRITGLAFFLPGLLSAAPSLIPVCCRMGNVFIGAVGADCCGHHVVVIIEPLVEILDTSFGNWLEDEPLLTSFDFGFS